MTYAASYAGTTFVSDLAHTLLASAVNAMGASVPANTYVKFGPPVAEGCDQLVVWVNDFHLNHPRRQTAFGGGGMSEERNSMEPQGVIPAVNFTVSLRRCGVVPNLQGEFSPAPNLTAEDVDATSLLTDGWALYHGLINAWQAGTLFGSTVPAHHTLFTTFKPYGPEGGIAGWDLPIKCTLY